MKFLIRTLWIALIGIFLFSFFVVGKTLTTLPLPSSETPTYLYSTETRDDLQSLFLQSIEEAQESILLIIYSLNDNAIIHALKRKSYEGVRVTVICDADASRGVHKKLGAKVHTTMRKGKALMHQKILVIDEQTVWIGSANMTPTSLKMHGNLVMGLHSGDLASLVEKKADAMTQKGLITTLPAQKFQIGNQTIEMWFLPDNPEGAQRIKQLLRTAKKSIKVAMFTWTRHDFAKEIVDAKARGLDVNVVMDGHSAGGVSAKAAEILQKGGVDLRLSTGGDTLLHHKFAVIDDSILINGSANWTFSAFLRNDDCFMVIFDLTSEQKEKLSKVWSIIHAESTPAKAGGRSW